MTLRSVSRIRNPITGTHLAEEVAVGYNALDVVHDIFTGQTVYDVRNGIDVVVVYIELYWALSSKKPFKSSNGKKSKETKVVAFTHPNREQFAASGGLFSRDKRLELCQVYDAEIELNHDHMSIPLKDVLFAPPTVDSDDDDDDDYANDYEVMPKKEPRLGVEGFDYSTLLRLRTVVTTAHDSVPCIKGNQNLRFLPYAMISLPTNQTDFVVTMHSKMECNVYGKRFIVDQLLPPFRLDPADFPGINWTKTQEHKSKWLMLFVTTFLDRLAIAV